MADDVGVHSLSQHEPDGDPLGDSVRIGIWNVRQPSRVRETHDDGRRGLLEMLSNRQVGRGGSGCEGPVQEGALAVGRTNPGMLAENLGESRQYLVTEVKQFLIRRQRHGVLLSDAGTWLSYFKPASRKDQNGRLGRSGGTLRAASSKHQVPVVECHD